MAGLLCPGALDTVVGRADAPSLKLDTATQASIGRALAVSTSDPPPLARAGPISSCRPNLARAGPISLVQAQSRRAGPISLVQAQSRRAGPISSCRPNLGSAHFVSPHALHVERPQCEQQALVHQRAPANAVQVGMPPLLLHSAFTPPSLLLPIAMHSSSPGQPRTCWRRERS